jgi:multidrug transporter EmrE-like cation transporter
MSTAFEMRLPWEPMQNPKSKILKPSDLSVGSIQNPKSKIQNRMTTSGFYLVILSAVLTVAANILLRIGVVRAGGLGGNSAELLNSLLRLVSQPSFDIGFLLYGLASLVWFRVISTEPLNIAYPLLVSMTFVLVTLGATLVFHESMTFRQFVGLAVVLTGIVLISGK